MNHRRVLVAILAVALVVGCTHSLAPSVAAAVASESNRLLREHPRSGEIARSQWPPSISALDPERVYAAPEGLYICTSIRFVEERGFFVPNPTLPFVAERGIDPSYTPVASGIFSYQLKG